MQKKSSIFFCISECKYLQASPPLSVMTLKASPLSNRGCDRREYPRTASRQTTCTQKGCPIHVLGDPVRVGVTTYCLSGGTTHPRLLSVDASSVLVVIKRTVLQQCTGQLFFIRREPFTPTSLTSQSPSPHGEVRRGLFSIDTIRQFIVVIEVVDQTALHGDFRLFRQ